MEKKSNCPNIEPLSTCFSLLNREEWENISGGQNATSFNKGELILKQGIMPNNVLFITQGYVLKYLETDEGRAVNVDILREGDFIGIQTVLNIPNCVYSFRSLTNVDACLINLDKLKSLLESNASFALRLLKKAAEDENSLMQFHISLTYKQMRGKLAKTLLFLADERHVDLNVFGLLSRKDIANFAGISHINAVKILKEMDMEKIIQLKDKNIYIVNKTLLEHVAKVG
jgi:CRP/FNR family transcriptional regulator